MSKISLDEALTLLGPTFLQEVRKLLAPIKDRAALMGLKLTLGFISGK